MSNLKSLLSRGKASTQHKAHRLKEEVSRIGEKITDNHLCLGITGLSGSGKTTFISSLINQLLSFDQPNVALSGFPPALSQRILGVKLHTTRIDGGKVFPYQESYQALCGNNPRWPQSTTDISGCTVEIKIKKSPSLLSGIGKPYHSLYLEILDYPGEWLLDLPMRQQSYSQWCQQFYAQYQHPQRAAILQQWLPELDKLDPLATFDPAVVEQLVMQFKSMLSQ
ncbi:MAG: YcjX family protein, partial [Gammaproteobacteria bacterium]|nr:YcjX family protein [Gammaproteobacteria bacterium]